MLSIRSRRRREAEKLARERHARGRPEQYVHDDQVRILRVDQRACLGGLGGLADDLEIRLCGEQRAEPFAEEAVIVDQRNSVAHAPPLPPNAAEREVQGQATTQAHVARIASGRVVIRPAATG